jgi:4-hydroxy-tetrahydrodipicolinate reductase
VWGSNFSIGMQFFFRVMQKSAEFLKSMPEFEVGITDTHHNRKKDAPSGTAISLAKLFIDENPNYSDYTTDPLESVKDKSKMHISSFRLGNVIGDHTVKIDSPYESIEFTHSAKNRNGFALGVLEAASWIHEKKGFYSFDKVLESMWD